MSDPYSHDVFGLTVRKNSHRDMRFIKNRYGAAAIHGNKFWKSTAIMIDYLRASPPEQGCRILEVGCGWGVSGIYCAKYFDAQVVGLDADESVFPYMKYHAQLNGVTVEAVKCRYEKITKSMLSEFDMLIASDICFWDEMTQPLINLNKRCYQAGIKRVVMTDPGRAPFREMASQCADIFDALYENWSVPHPYNTSGLVLDIS